MSVIHLYAPEPTEEGVCVIDCPTCGRMRRAHFTCYAWLGVDVHCAGCGEHWQDGERAERPFAPGWRRRNIEWTRAQLARIGVQA